MSLDLAARFYEDIADGPLDGAARDGLVDELRDALSRACVANAEFSVDQEAFLDHLASHAGAQVFEPGWTSSLHLADLMLAFACGQGCAAAARHLRARVAPTIESAARKVDSAPAFIDEVCQRVYEKLLVRAPDRPPRILAYGGTGPIEGWIRVTAARTAIDLFRQRCGAADAAEPVLDQLEADVDDPELAYIRLRYADEVNDAFRHAFQSLSARERTVLRLHLLDGLNIDRIGALYQVHRATVARWIAHAREVIVQASRRNLQQRLGATDSEVESLERLVRSDLHVCLSDVLASSTRSGSDG